MLKISYKWFIVCMDIKYIYMLIYISVEVMILVKIFISRMWCSFFYSKVDILLFYLLILFCKDVL